MHFCIDFVWTISFSCVILHLSDSISLNCFFADSILTRGNHSSFIFFQSHINCNSTTNKRTGKASALIFSRRYGINVVRHFAEE